MNFKRALVGAVILAVPASFCLWLFFPAWVWYVHPGDPMAAINKTLQAAPYQILDDDLGNFITIAIPSQVTIEQLQATLVKVANEHQDDRARDYLMSAYFVVDAYLLQDQRKSQQRAGRLTRYVPFSGPEERRNMKRDRSMFDKFETSLDEAKRSMP